MVDRRVEYLPVEDIQPAPRNPKGHDHVGIARSIGHFGFAEIPLLDERTGRLVAGHGRYDQLKALCAEGHSPPEGIRVDDTGRWLMPVIRGWASRSDADAEAYLIASNQLTTKGGWDEHALTEILHDLGEAQMLELTGYDPDDLDALEALMRSGSFDGDDDQALADTDRASWPVIRAQVDPDTYARWQAVAGKDDADRVRVVLDEAGL